MLRRRAFCARHAPPALVLHLYEHACTAAYQSPDALHPSSSSFKHSLASCCTRKPEHIRAKSANVSVLLVALQDSTVPPSYRQTVERMQAELDDCAAVELVNRQLREQVCNNHNTCDLLPITCSEMLSCSTNVCDIEVEKCCVVSPMHTGRSRSASKGAEAVRGAASAAAAAS